MADPLVMPIRRLAGSIWQWLGVRVSRLLGRPVTLERTMADSITLSGEVAAKVMTPEFPALPQDQAEAIAELNRRTIELRERLIVVRDGDQQARETLRRDFLASTQELTSAIEATQAQSRKIATGGIRLNMAGLVIVVSGLFLQGLSSVMR